MGRRRKKKGKKGRGRRKEGKGEEEVCEGKREEKKRKTEGILSEHVRLCFPRGHKIFKS